MAILCEVDIYIPSGHPFLVLIQFCNRIVHFQFVFHFPILTQSLLYRISTLPSGDLE